MRQTVCVCVGEISAVPHLIGWCLFKCSDIQIIANSNDMLKENGLPLIKMIKTNTKHWKTANFFSCLPF